MLLKVFGVNESPLSENQDQSVHVLNDESLGGNEKLPEAVNELFIRSSVHLTLDQKVKLKSLLKKNVNLFSKSKMDIGKASGIKHTIHTGDAPPMNQPLRRLPFHKQEEADSQVEDMLKAGVIEPSCSPWNSGIVLVEKKDGSQRFCVDFRLLNKVTQKSSWPLARIEDQLNSLEGSKWFSTLDITSAYWTVEMEEASKEKTAFSTRMGHRSWGRL